MKLGPDFSAVYGIRPWEYELLTEAELLEHMDYLKRLSEATGG